jgi:hypothetical protein
MIISYMANTLVAANTFDYCLFITFIASTNFAVEIFYNKAFIVLRICALFYFFIAAVNDEIIFIRRTTGFPNGFDVDYFRLDELAIFASNGFGDLTCTIGI